MSDNYHFDLTGVALDKSLDIAFGGAPGHKAWGHVAGSPYAFAAIEPVWLMYGK